MCRGGWTSCGHSGKNPGSRDVWVKPRREWRDGHMLTCRENRCLKTKLPGVDVLRSTRGITRGRCEEGRTQRRGEGGLKSERRLSRSNLCGAS